MSTEPKKHNNEMTDGDNEIIDLVLKTLYASADKPALDFEREILVAGNILRPAADVERLWHILTGSEWVQAVAGFGEAGKLTLTPAGIRLMLEHGSYLSYLSSAHKVKPAKVTVHHIAPEDDAEAKTLQRRTDKGKR